VRQLSQRVDEAKCGCSAESLGKSAILSQSHFATDFDSEQNACK
jgi:hypothetical protein